ncbi:phosphoribosylformylglycinamidine synthase [Tepidibacter hydrothermalis]|uniref:Phosphoribosylformylglycinamidine synthase n=1 Tax=Tepidibacter hydrothermalis TaxID=3036126 RepID=A0ABY8EAJ4_9FIRM|nr:phosphoribosylformylglycinamidine synthase [Tepidibacter hydrothermalis]WFD09935.1 phosphoribosylformylglycinamidine synthase [Tepidibacter hydrothermalis]
MSNIKRLFVEKKSGFDVEAKKLLRDIKLNLGIKNIDNIRVLNRYDIENISEDVYEKSVKSIFSEPNIDNVYHENIDIDDNSKMFAIEYLPGQYDQRADWAVQCIEILTQNNRPLVNFARTIVIDGEIDNTEFENIKNYLINPVDSREARLDKPENLVVEIDYVDEVEVVDGFIDMDENNLKDFIKDRGLAMMYDDLVLIQGYFRDTEKRNPTITEIKIIDTYWSDHCRHTTFLTKVESVEIEDGKYSDIINKTYEEYKESRSYVYESREKDITLMDIATISMKELRKKGLLEDLDVSEEINACSINVDVEIDGKNEKYLVMFKNETHNHPTEIEPFGGAATCLGGAIRDPLSGRSYVYQAMRISGCANPLQDISDTLDGKLPQIKITKEAAHGYSSYGNQIGVATGFVDEVYDDDFVAKRMEVGAVIAATPKDEVIRKIPQASDVVILVGGRTGKDGCGGATGSSKEHSEESISTCSAEVQKGNAPTERKIQRLFRNKKVSSMIKRCNDFGAGGVCVAIGELADGIDIDLNKVPKKYEGLDGTEIAISESQERMAVVIDKENLEEFIKHANEENVEATHVATVTDTNRVRMSWNEKLIVDVSRDFLNTNGAKQYTDVLIKSTDEDTNYFENTEIVGDNLEDKWINRLKDLNVCSKRGLIEMFDTSIGAGTVLMPLGGKYQSTPADAMVCKIPVLKGSTDTASAMAYGYNPKIGKWSPFHGAIYALVESVCKIVSVGGDYSNIRLTLQEYFEKIGKNKEKWGKPFSALLGAYLVQKKLNIPAIGGKDSMSGTFEDINVPPTLISFAVDIVDSNYVISPEFKKANSKVVLLSTKKDDNYIVDFDCLKSNLDTITKNIRNKNIISAYPIKGAGICEAVSKMSFGNKIGFEFKDEMSDKELFSPDYGSFILEVEDKVDVDEIFKNCDYKVLGSTNSSDKIEINNIEIEMDTMYSAWSNTLEKVFPTKTTDINQKIETLHYEKTNIIKPRTTISKPKVLVPVFPGTNCEYDCIKAFERVGGDCHTSIFKNLKSQDIQDSIDDFVKKINQSQIIMLPGGFSAGDEPDGSAKFIVNVLKNPRIKEAIMELLNNRDGLMLGICNGFQALIKLGLLPYGEIKDIDENDPTLTYNNIARHQSKAVETKIVSNISPWMSNVKVGDIHSIPISHGEGRFVCNEDMIEKLIKNGQIATQYVDRNQNATYDIDFNPNGSFYAVEGITSPDGRILGKMGHSERIGDNVLKNIHGNTDQKLFKSGIEYFKL